MTKAEWDELEAGSPLDRIESPVMRERIRKYRLRLSSESYQQGKKLVEWLKSGKWDRETNTSSGGSGVPTA